MGAGLGAALGVGLGVGLGTIARPAVEDSTVLPPAPSSSQYHSMPHLHRKTACVRIWCVSGKLGVGRSKASAR